MNKDKEEMIGIRNEFIDRVLILNQKIDVYQLVINFLSKEIKR